MNGMAISSFCKLRKSGNYMLILVPTCYIFFHKNTIDNLNKASRSAGLVEVLES